MWSVPEMFEDTKRAIRNRKSRDRQYNGESETVNRGTDNIMGNQKP